jgi:release factor glutamine methyltransferase
MLNETAHYSTSVIVEADVLLQYVLSPSFNGGLSGAECVSSSLRRQHAQWVMQWPSIRASQWHSDALTRLTPAQRLALSSALYRRVEREEPLAYVTGTRHFWSHLFWVQTHPMASPNARAFIPRPESELLVECAVEAMLTPTYNGYRHGRMLEVGVGTGCVLLSVLTELYRLMPHGEWYAVGTDWSPACVRLARLNAQHILPPPLLSRVHFFHCNWTDNVSEKFDLIVSNPPYVSSSEYATLPSFSHYEPSLALLAGDDGLQAYRALAFRVPHLLSTSGSLLLVEIGGVTQCDAVISLFEATGCLRHIRTVRDGNEPPQPRCLIFSRI